MILSIFASTGHHVRVVNVLLWFISTLCNTDGTFTTCRLNAVCEPPSVPAVHRNVFLYSVQTCILQKPSTWCVHQSNECSTSSFQIYWVRDGVEVQPERDPNFLQASDGHLIIVQVRWMKYIHTYSLRGCMGPVPFVVDGLTTLPSRVKFEVQSTSFFCVKHDNFNSLE